MIPMKLLLNIKNLGEAVCPIGFTYFLKGEIMQKQLKYFASNKTESGKKKFKPGGLFPLKIFSFYKE